MWEMYFLAVECSELDRKQAPTRIHNVWRHASCDAGGI